MLLMYKDGAFQCVMPIAISDAPKDCQTFTADTEQACLLQAVSLGLTGVPIPDISNRQVRLWMFNNNITDAQITAAINALPAPQNTEALINYQYAVTWHRTDPFVTNIGTALGLSPAQLDAAFITASAL